MGIDKRQAFFSGLGFGSTKILSGRGLRVQTEPCLKWLPSGYPEPGDCPAEQGLALPENLGPADPYKNIVSQRLDTGLAMY